MPDEVVIKSPAFQFYPGHFFGDRKVRRLSADCTAFYALLLLNIWEYDASQYRIKDDDTMIAGLLRISLERWCSFREELQLPGQEIFVEEDGYLISPRLKMEKEKQRKWSKAQQEKAIKSWEKRRQHES